MLLASAGTIKKLRETAQERAISRLRLETLQELLDAIRRREPEQKNLLSMLDATAAHLSMVMGQPASKIPIRQLLEIKPALQRHLKERGFRRNTVRSYANYFRILLDKARSLGWSESSPELENAWRNCAASRRKRPVVRGSSVMRSGTERRRPTSPRRT